MAQPSAQPKTAPPPSRPKPSSAKPRAAATAAAPQRARRQGTRAPAAGLEGGEGAEKARQLYEMAMESAPFREMMKAYTVWEILANTHMRVDWPVQWPRLHQQTDEHVASSHVGEERGMGGRREGRGG